MRSLESLVVSFQFSRNGLNRNQTILHCSQTYKCAQHNNNNNNNIAALIGATADYSVALLPWQMSRPNEPNENAIYPEIDSDQIYKS